MKHNRYWLPQWRRQEVIGFIAGYNDKVAEHRDRIEQSKSSSDIDGMPHGSNTADETFLKAASVERLFDDIRIIEQCIRKIPPQYQKGVWHSIIPDENGRRWPFPKDAHVNTYSHWRRVYIFHVHSELSERGM